MTKDMTTMKIQNIKSHLLRSLLVVVMMVWGVESSWATDYVLTYVNNGTVYFVARNGTSGVQRVNQFDATTCIWSCEDSNGNASSLSNSSTYGYLYQNVSNNKYYLTSGGGTLSVTTEKHGGQIVGVNTEYTRWRTDGTYIYNYTAIGRNFYIELKNGSSSKNNSSSSCAKPVVVTSETVPESGTFDVSFTAPDTLAWNKDYHGFSVSPSLSVNNYAPEQTKYTMNPDYDRTYYSLGSTTQAWNKITLGYSDFTPTWSVDGDDADKIAIGNANSLSTSFTYDPEVDNENGSTVTIKLVVQHSTMTQYSKTATQNVLLLQGKRYTITTGVNPENSGEVSGAGKYKVGDNATLKATANRGYKFKNWNNDNNNTNNPLTIYQHVDSAYIAYFVENQRIRYAEMTGGSVTAKVDNEVVTIADQDATVTLTANPASGYGFENVAGNWTVTDEATNNTITVTPGENNTCTFTMPAGNVTVSAIFKETGYTITTKAEPLTGGTITGGGVFAKGGSTTLTARANEGYTFSKWDDGVTTNPRVIENIQADATYTAYFTAKKYNVQSVTPAEGGTFTISETEKDGDNDVAGTGSVLTLTATPAEGYDLGSWKIMDANDADITSTVGLTLNAQDGNKATFNMPAKDVKVTATFTLHKYKINLTQPAGGTISSDPAISAEKDTEVTLSYTANPGYEFQSWTVVSGDITITDNKFTMPTNDVTISATFVAKTYNIRVNATGGTVTPSSTTGKAGDVITLTATPDAKNTLYSIKGERDDNHEEFQISKSGTNYSFTMPTSNVTITAEFKAYQTGPCDDDPSMYWIASLSDITDANGRYRLAIDNPSGEPGVTEFSGTLDGYFHTISGRSSALFDKLNGATVKNVTLDNVKIYGTGNVGAIANEATNSKIYNCGVLSGSVSGSNAVGGIVGLLSGTTKVINCYNYASISGGEYAAGVVGRLTSRVDYLHKDDGTSIDDWPRPSSNTEGNYGANNTNRPNNYSGSLSGGTIEVWRNSNSGSLQNQDILHNTISNLPAGTYSISMVLVINKANPSGIQFNLNGQTSNINNSEVVTNNGYYEAHISRQISIEDGGSLYFGFRLNNANFNWMQFDNVVVSMGVDQLTNDMYHQWSTYQAGGTISGNGNRGGSWGTDYSNGGTVYGDVNVSGNNYADLSDYSTLALTVASGTPRLLFNRQANDNSGTNNYLEINNQSSEYVLKVENDVWYIDLNKVKTWNNLGYAHLNVIKSNWGTTTNITNAVLYRGDDAMVANCLNYSTELSGTKTYPVYGGNDLDNKQKPLYDFFLYDGVKDFTSTNGALPAEARFLNRFEYIRATLNAEKKLMAYYLFGDQTATSEIGKWVLDTEIAPYPIIKKWGKYPSLVNPDYTFRTEGTLSVTISGYSGGAISLPISDQKEDEFDYGYHKVQLPYYNDYFNNNYQANKVVTGWKITSVSGGTAGSFTTSGDNAYNFADRNCTQKDLFSVSGRVFAQGGFYYVPEGVTGITIEPYWANDVVYAYDPNLDKVYGMGYSETNYGPTYQPTFTVPNGAKTAYSLRAAHNLLSTTTNVYDHAIVMIGNLNARSGGSPVDNTGSAYTLMSIDEDKDNEPDYVEIYGHVNMQNIPPTRLDFVHQVGISWVKKPMGESLQSYSGIAMTRGHFEITETAFARFTEFETGRNNDYVADAPLIFNGGLIDQFVTIRYTPTDKVNYAILGGHTYFNAYTPGCHAGTAQKTTLFPVSVMGGEYEEFYLTGRKAEVEVDENNHGRVYTNGGKMGTFAAGYWEQLNGNAYIRFDHTKVGEFYGGSVNPAKPITGNIDIIINNSDVEFFCAGPKAGNMTEGKTVKTVANNTRFGTYVGAGYGGSSVARIQRQENVNENDFMYYKNTFFNNYFNNDYLKYSEGNGILIRYAIEYMPGSGGMGSSGNPTQVTRFFDDYAQLSLARTYSVSSELTGCTITGNYYGGPWSGTVGTGTGTAPTVTSSLKNCTVQGSVFGGGKSAEIPTITVYPREASALKDPLYSGDFGMYYQQGEDEFPVYPTGTEYTWVYNNTTTPSGNQTDHTLQTNVDLTNLGTIFGNTSLTIDGGTVAGNVYGAGDASKVTGNTEVTIKNNARIANVFGGGNEANLGGKTTVNQEGGMVSGAIYGGGALANVGGDTQVNLKSGTVGSVYGGGLGRLASGTEGQPGYVAPIAATVGSATINIGSGTPDNSATGGAKDVAGSCQITGSVFGCNNLNGTPTGNATVNVFKTYNATPDEPNSYNSKIEAVYGGGNLAAYVPTADTSTAKVTVYTCKNQIDYVYGGGNAASTPATNVTIWGGKMKNVFGGGNGAGEGNPGADVGYKDFTWDDSHAYGAGTTNVNIWGGVIENVFGGSNTRGNIRVSSNVNLDDKEGCEFKIGGVYGAGNEAAMYGNGNLVIGCIPGMTEIYGGSKAADINGDVSLTITNGTFGKVFGGNNLGGKLNGSITVNIEETGCRPVIISELYGCGNQAPYSVYGYEEALDANGKVVVKESGTKLHADPVVNIYSCTNIGSVYGGGYGAGAVVVGSPTVNINQVKGTPNNVESSALGTIGTVFGGGNAARVVGDTHVNIGTLKKYTVLYGDAKGHEKTIVGANITGNVYGGGNAAEVTGKTNVVIGADKQ